MESTCSHLCVSGAARLLLLCLCVWAAALGDARHATAGSRTSRTSPLVSNTTGGAAGGDVPSTCNVSRCNKRMMRYYEDLDCKPIPGGEDSCCPASYNCDHLLSRDANKCYFGGKAFEAGERLDKPDALNPCMVQCYCQAQDNRTAFFCVTSECPDMLQPRLQPNCIHVYEAGVCCSTHTYCQDGAAPTPKYVCVYDGQAYIEGQYMYPDDAQCKSCICQQGFNGSLDGPWCSDIKCDIELRSGHQIQEGCAPIYYGNEVCCPVDWRCPTGNDTVVASSSSRKSGGLRCRFGKLELHVGDTLSPGDNLCVTCSCTVPPHVSCVQARHDVCSSNITPTPRSAPSTVVGTSATGDERH